MSREFNNDAQTFKKQAIRTLQRRHKCARTAVNANLLVVCSLFKWHKVHFYCTPKKTRVSHTKLNELYKHS